MPMPYASESTSLPKPVASSYYWQDEANCLDMPLNLFFYEEGERGEQRRDTLSDAKTICASCPVRANCLEHALSVPEKFGIWGGYDEKERWSMLRKMGKVGKANKMKDSVKSVYKWVEIDGKAVKVRIVD